MNVWSCFKEEQIRQRSLRLHPIAMMILCDMLFWAKTNDCPFVVTDTVSTEAEDLELKRVSSTHRDARAFDISLREWDATLKQRFITHFRLKYDIYSAMGKDGKNRLIVEHDAGTGNHLHVQLSTAFKGGFENPA